MSRHQQHSWMTVLRTHEQFEAMWHPKEHRDRKETVVLYFTATWCSACKRLDWLRIRETFPKQKFMICDIDENDYTPGYLNVRSIPAFVIVKKDGTLVGPYTQSDTAALLLWLEQNL